MKAILAFAFLIASISASVVPESETGPLRNERFVTDGIISAIEDVSQQIRDEGLDPLYIKREVFSYALPVPVIFNAAAFVEELLSTGLSDIVVNEMNYSILWSRLDFAIEMPHIHLSAQVASGAASLFENTLTADVNGRVDVRGINIKGQVRVNVGIISGISVSSVTADFSIASITSNIRLAIQGQNYSEDINTFISSTIPETLEAYKNEINELIEIVLKDVINDNL